MWILIQVLTLIKDAVRAVRAAPSCIPDGVEAANPQFVGLKVQCRFFLFPFANVQVQFDEFDVSLCKFQSRFIRAQVLHLCRRECVAADACSAAALSRVKDVACILQFQNLNTCAKKRGFFLTQWKVSQWTVGLHVKDIKQPPQVVPLILT